MGYVALELDPVGAAFPDSVAWEFKLRPAVRGGIPSGGEVSGFVRRVYMRGTVDFLLGARRQRVVRLEGEISYRPDEDELSLGFELVLLSW